MDIEQCLQYICNWYYSDTIELFDLVLYDNSEDPQYSAITTLNRFWVLLQLKRQRQGEEFENRNVSSLIEDAGYTSKDIELFRKKAREELDTYTADVFDMDFILNGTNRNKD